MATTVPPRDTDTQVLTPPADTDATLAGAVPRLAEGVELIGRFEDSGFKDPPYIARRADGQVVQMPQMLFALAEEVDGGRPYEEIAERFSDRIERGVTGEMVETLIDGQLRPLGVVAPKDGHEQELKKVDPLLALKFRTKVVPQRVVAGFTTVFQRLFHAPVVVLVVGAFAALAVWLFGIHGVSQSLRHVIYEPALVPLLLGGVALATAFHEIGHASACRFGGAKPGVMGVGIYIVWPAFYTDITDAYRLDKRGRLRTDLGGIYFNMVFALGVAGVYALTSFEPLLLLVVLQFFAIVQQSLPFLRLDGYYVISDLTGVPDILMRMRAILTSILPRREPDERVTVLKPWVRVVVTAYVLVLVPVITFIFAILLIHAPRVFATAWDSFWVHLDRVGPAFGAGEPARGAFEILQMAVLVLPAMGLGYTATRVAHRFGTAGWSWSAGNPARRAGVVTAATGAVAVLVFLWWPQGEYKPIQPSERGTLVGALRSIADVPSGRPSLTPERERELGGAPTERELQREGKQRPLSGDPGAGAERGDSGQDDEAERGDPSARDDGSTAPEPGADSDANPEEETEPGTQTGPTEGAPESQLEPEPEQTTIQPDGTPTQEPQQPATEPSDGTTEAPAP